jgi:hypothetical protein
MQMLGKDFSTEGNTKVSGERERETAIVRYLEKAGTSGSHL